MPPLPPPARKRVPKPAAAPPPPPPPQPASVAGAPPAVTAPAAPSQPATLDHDALQKTLDTTLDTRLASSSPYDPATAAATAAAHAAALRDACAPLLPARTKLVAHVAVDQDDGGTWASAARCLWEGGGGDGVASAARVVGGARVTAVVVCVGVP